MFASRRYLGISSLRLSFFAMGLLLAAFAVRSASASLVSPDEPVCHEAPRIATYSPVPLPDTHYLYSETYGWFDTSHFNTGRPAQVLADVRAAAAGGGLVLIRQGVHDDITGYSAAYQIADQLDPSLATAAALGIYLDWSIRFEAWQAEPPQGLLGPTSPFAVEDLPSQYVGFMAAALDTPVDRLISCYLGPVSGSNEGPPDVVPANQTAAIDGWAGFARLDNPSFFPMTRTDGVWDHTRWPEPLQMSPLAPGPDTWRFVSAATWYLGDTSSDQQLEGAFRHTARRRSGR